MHITYVTLTLTLTLALTTDPITLAPSYYARTTRHLLELRGSNIARLFRRKEDARARTWFGLGLWLGLGLGLAPDGERSETAPTWLGSEI